MEKSHEIKIDDGATDYIHNAGAIYDIPAPSKMNQRLRTNGKGCRPSIVYDALNWSFYYLLCITCFFSEESLPTRRSNIRLVAFMTSIYKTELRTANIFFFKLHLHHIIGLYG
ncbi:hypothetical protein BH18THE2_BH18THE2_21490 [soil metagenome]